MVQWANARLVCWNSYAPLPVFQIPLQSLNVNTYLCRPSSFLEHQTTALNALCAANYCIFYQPVSQYGRRYSLVTPNLRVAAVCVADATSYSSL